VGAVVVCLSFACHSEVSHLLVTLSAAKNPAFCEAVYLCRKHERSPKGEATENIAFALPLFFFAFSAQKSNVKPQNHLTRSNQSKSSGNNIA